MSWRVRNDEFAYLGPEHTKDFVEPQVATFCGGDIFSHIVNMGENIPATKRSHFWLYEVASVLEALYISY